MQAALQFCLQVPSVMFFVARLSLNQVTLAAAAPAKQHATLRCMSAPSKAPMLVAHASAMEEALKSWVVGSATA